MYPAYIEYIEELASMTYNEYRMYMLRYNI